MPSAPFLIPALGSSFMRSETNHDSKPEWKLDIDLELLQVLPNMSTEDFIIHQVGSSNLAMCVRLWNERKVFDIGALLMWSRIKPHGGIMGGKDQSTRAH